MSMSVRSLPYYDGYYAGSTITRPLDDKYLTFVRNSFIDANGVLPEYQQDNLENNSDYDRSTPKDFREYITKFLYDQTDMIQDVIDTINNDYNYYFVDQAGKRKTKSKKARRTRRR